MIWVITYPSAALVFKWEWEWQLSLNSKKIYQRAWEEFYGKNNEYKSIFAYFMFIFTPFRTNKTVYLCNLYFSRCVKKTNILALPNTKIDY